MGHSRVGVSFPCRPFDQPGIERWLSVFIGALIFPWKPAMLWPFQLSWTGANKNAQSLHLKKTTKKLPFKQGYQTHQSIYGGRECMKHHIAEVNTLHFLPLCYHRTVCFLFCASFKVTVEDRRLIGLLSDVVSFIFVFLYYNSLQTSINNGTSREIMFTPPQK